MPIIRTKLELLAYSALEDSNITNADAKTIAHHVRCLADQIAQLCDEYREEQEKDAANYPDDLQQYLGSPAYYRTSSLL